jgi:hypothetical protein
MRRPWLIGGIGRQAHLASEHFFVLQEGPDDGIYFADRVLGGLGVFGATVADRRFPFGMEAQQRIFRCLGVSRSRNNDEGCRYASFKAGHP